MSGEWFCIGILLVLLIAQQRQIQLLINKLMSKNYSDFAQGERLRKPTNVPKAPPQSAVLDPIADRHANEANKLFFA